ncbi:class I adenylate-forming enzyme family protein [Sedimenticola selenatireducens]|uniref:class I adenylate-forming enzyme family protein n=1 Tax=Sedimenticola selenatireducens TaxID=191960 RepID=UPI00048CACA6|nr:AMP-binding protein [Sedimenticola selenatireducens]
MTRRGLLSVVRECFEREADAPAVMGLGVDCEEQVSFCELWIKAEIYATLIKEYHRPDQVVPLFLTRCVDCLALMLACVIAGRVFSVINSRVQVTQLEHVLKQTQTGALWIDGPGMMALKKADTDQLEYLSGIDILALKTENWLSMYDKQVIRMQDQLSIRVLSSNDFRKTPVSQVEKRDPLSPSACLFTSGSTGKPKGVLISDADLISRAVSEAQNFRLNPGDRLLSILPWSFDVGLSQVLTSWVIGCPLVLLNSWLPIDIVQTASRLSITGISAVPSIWLDLLGSNLSFQSPLPRYVTISGGSLSAEKQAALIQRLDGIQVIKTYGQTETCRSTIAFPDDIAVAPSSVGRAYSGTCIYIVDADMRPLPPNEHGEVLHVGDGVMLGYLDGDSSSKLIENPFYDPPCNSSKFAVRTGDLGYMDAEGRLHLLGRADDMVKIKGNRVHLSEVASEAEALPEIQQALPVVLAEGDQLELALFVTLAEDNPPLDETGLRRRLATYLPSYMLPKQILILDRFPRTASGKPDSQALKIIAINQRQQGVIKT